MNKESNPIPEVDPRIERKREEMKKIIQESIDRCVELLKGLDATEVDAELIAPVIGALRKIEENIK